MFGFSRTKTRVLRKRLLEIFETASLVQIILSIMRLILTFNKTIFFDFAIFSLILIYIAFVADPFSIYLGASLDIVSFSNITIVQLVSGIFIAPIIEELIFRFHLSGLKKDFFSWPISMIIFIFVFRDLGAYFMLFASLISLLFYSLVLKSNDELFWKRIYGFLYITGSLMFALCHFPLIEVDTMSNKIIIVLISFTPISFYLGYIRHKRGLLFSICTHSSYNFSLLILNNLLY